MTTRRAFSSLALAGLATSVAGCSTASSNSAGSGTTQREINGEVRTALARLRRMPNAAPLLRQARATLVFPRIISGGFIVGGQYGNGALVRDGREIGYYNIAGVSLGLLAGVQAEGLAIFFITSQALAALDRVAGFEIGGDLSVAVLDRGVQANATSTTLTEPAYAITFNQEGLMAAIALNGTKVTRINPPA